MKRNVILMFLVSLVVAVLTGCILSSDPSPTSDITLNVGASQTFSVKGIMNGPYVWSKNTGEWHVGWQVIPGESGPSLTYTAVCEDVNVNGQIMIRVQTTDLIINKPISVQWLLTINDVNHCNPLIDLLNSMVPIPAGSFMMGSTDNEYGWAQYTTPVHMVWLQYFKIGAYEVTQAQYEAVMGVNPSYFQGPGTENNPVEQVSWYDARAFCTALSRLTGGRTFTLPSEAQWEYACRAGTTTLYSYGDSDALLGDYAWYWDNSGSQTHPVGTKLPNPWGLYDMHGNVLEWCLDSGHGNYTGAPTDGSAWDPETDIDHEIRGGCWGLNLPGYFRSAWRNSNYTTDRYAIIGFRIVEIP